MTHLKYLANANLLFNTKILTVAVDRPESSDATLIPFERVVTFVSGTLYKDYKNNMTPNQFSISNFLETGTNYNYM